MTDPNTPSDKKTISSLETAFDIVELVAVNNGMTPDELVNQLGYSRSTIHYYLVTLEKHRFLVRGDEGYQIGSRFLHYGNTALRNHDLTGIVRKEVDSLAEQTGRTALFAIQEQGRSVFLCQSPPDDTTDYYLGIEQHLLSSAFGKVLLACSPEETLNTIVEQHELSEELSNDEIDHKALSREFSTIREQGFAYEESENEYYSCSLAVPIIQNRERERVGAIGIIGKEGEISDPETHVKAQRFAEKPVTIVKRHAQILRDKVT